MTSRTLRENGPVGVSDKPRKFKQYGRSDTAPLSDDKWWTLDDSRVHAAVNDLADRIEADQSLRFNQYAYYAALYGAYETLPAGSFRAQAMSVKARFRRRAMAFNVIKQCVDAATNKIGKNEPKPVFLTNGGDPTLQRRVKWMTKYVAGVFRAADVREKAKQCFRDACMYGTGVLGLSWQQSKGGWKLRADRILPHEILIDDQDGMYGEPSCVIHQRLVPIEKLRALYGPKADLITQDARGTNAGRSPTGWRSAVVREAWHLPSSPDAKDGRRVVVAQGVTLESEEWEADEFPFCFFRWSDPEGYGFWGTSLTHELIQIQVAINKNADAIQRSLDLVARPRVFVDGDSEVLPSALRPNDDVAIVKVSGGREPKFLTPSANNPEMYQWFRDLKAMAFEQTGISQTQAQAQRPPPGMDSGAAQREWNDTADSRFTVTSQRWDRFHLQLAERIVDMSRRAAKVSGAGRLSVKTPDGRFAQDVDWKDAEMDEGEYSMELQAASALPDSKAARIQTVIDLVQAQMYKPEEGRAMLSLPDLEEQDTLADAAREDVRLTVEEILEEGKPGFPDEAGDLQYAVDYGLMMIARAKRAKYKAANRDLLRRYVDACQDKLDEQAAAAQPPAPQAGQAAPPAAVPNAPPTSDLMAVSDPLAKFDINSMSPMSGPAPASFDVLNAGGSSMDPMASLAKHSEFATQFQADPTGGMQASLISDPRAKQAVVEQGQAARDAEPARFMDAIGGGKAFRYKPGVPGEDPSEQHFGTTTADLKRTEMGATLVKRDPESGYEAIDVPEATSAMLAAQGNANQRIRALEAELDELKGRK